MAQFTASGRLKCLFSGDGLSVGFEAFHQRKAEEFGSATGALRFAYLRSLPHGNHKRRLCFFSGVTVHASTPSSSPVRNYSDDIFDDASEDDHAEIDIDELAGFRGLVLDISYRPVNVVCWRRAICLEYMDKADVLEYYDQTINSPSGSFYIPAVLRVPHLLQVVKRRKMKRGLSRKNIFHRDNFMCQYCSSQENLTVDHVLPIARGGKWTWENLVAACAKCNSKKGQKTLEEADMKLMKVPKAPKDFDILAIPLTNHAIKMLKARKGMPEEWRQYLSKPYVGP
ncbi:uncharacterized protein LOC127263115 isoform X2 [Andrographis paniculata]|uniref:uncharacterized protein LOC127263115 isoform X2 n=1 Tax=Andrographis paniculata TaxID=175694 RepID=UPI0021E7428C|nr:uncharacterized protein LOC127263115 isoform X2 [Andrographis paniculata]